MGWENVRVAHSEPRRSQRPVGVDARRARAGAAEVERLRSMTRAERLAEAMRLSRIATRLANAPKRGE
jgi:hypothetical protein